MLDRHISRRRFLTGTALAAGGAVAVPLLGACDASSDDSSGDGKTVTLTVMYKSNELTKEHIADFESRNPGIKINFVEFDDTRLNAMLASNEPPDFVRAPAVGSSSRNAQELATDLDPYLAKSTVLKKEDLLPVNDGFRWDGKRSGQGPYYGIVKDWSQDATLWYNRALFEQAKVPLLSPTEPVSYDELLEIAKKLTKKSGGKTQVYGLGVEWAWGLSAPIHMMILQQGGQVYNDDLTQTDMTTPEARRAIQWYVDFAQAGVGPTSLDPVPDGADLSLFLAKRMAITQDGYWYGGNFVKEADEIKNNVAMAPAPVMGDKRISPTYVGWGAFIPAKARHKDAAWKLMEYYMAGPPSEERAKSGWGMPGLKSQLSLLPQELPYQKQAYETAQAELQHAGPLPDSPYMTGSWIDVLNKHITRAIKKETTVEGACKDITNEVNKLLKQGKDQIG
ncbi:ABC transporter substrate-binding protein [Phytohabitans aurantiacus]|jgi:multiple sugar transport system substrate-binding protein|uniref:Sugar ABC transporter substrate-binding protein n=1 Tax=Phytohabitans aurantiacus TaxID=3016789 RepID=A0ABQ5R7P2_9ACTN|nr:sugar ABC transporter substrate-binding protein [Phytohabitans aurantiacus]GLI02591.1 sugar ABC transporter substrate-binding protein [Phytohabitans aurantiacus]